MQVLDVHHVMQPSRCTSQCTKWCILLRTAYLQQGFMSLVWRRELCNSYALRIYMQIDTSLILCRAELKNMRALAPFLSKKSWWPLLFDHHNFVPDSVLYSGSSIWLPVHHRLQISGSRSRRPVICCHASSLTRTSQTSSSMASLDSCELLGFLYPLFTLSSKMIYSPSYIPTSFLLLENGMPFHVLGFLRAFSKLGIPASSKREPYGVGSGVGYFGFTCQFLGLWLDG